MSLRDKYTDEEWDELVEKSKETPKPDLQGYKLEPFREARSLIEKYGNKEYARLHVLLMIDELNAGWIKDIGSIRRVRYWEDVVEAINLI